MEITTSVDRKFLQSNWYVFSSAFGSGELLMHGFVETANNVKTMGNPGTRIFNAISLQILVMIFLNRYFLKTILRSV